MGSGTHGFFFENNLVVADNISHSNNSEKKIKNAEKSKLKCCPICEKQLTRTENLKKHI
jgi:hypothetical protein